jgi:hypothetical protein
MGGQGLYQYGFSQPWGQKEASEPGGPRRDDSGYSRGPEAHYGLIQQYY